MSKEFAIQLSKEVLKKVPIASIGISTFEELEKKNNEDKRDREIKEISQGMKELLGKNKPKNKKIVRSARALMKELRVFEDKLWFNRHQMIKNLNDTKKIEINPEIWKRALKEENKMIKKYGKKNLGFYTDFEWGLLNGKISALRWLTGEKWDTLDS